MANNYLQPGHHLTQVAAAPITSGQLVVIGDCVGVAANAAAIGESVTIHVEGVFEVSKTAGAAWAVGDSLDFDVSTGAFHKGMTEAAGDVSNCAVAAAAAAAGATTAAVKRTPGAGRIN